MSGISDSLDLEDELSEERMARAHREGWETGESHGHPMCGYHQSVYREAVAKELAHKNGEIERIRQIAESAQKTANQLLEYVIRSDMRERTRIGERKARLEALLGGALDQPEAAPAEPVNFDAAFFEAFYDNDD